METSNSQQKISFDKFKKIVILGCGESGAGAAVLAKVKGYNTFVSDKGCIKSKHKDLLEKYSIEWEELQHTETKILNADAIVKSPGIPDSSAIIQKIITRNIPIISEIEFAGKFTNAKMICITGSNGKTTTTSLTYHIFKKAGLDVGLAGNIGKSLALQVAICDHKYYIIELSSFQLDNMYNFKADIAILLNITPDHLDRYNYRLQNYINSKFRIVQNQTPNDAFIFWNDDPIIHKELERHGIKAQIYPFSAIKKHGVIAYAEENKIKINKPYDFNMEQEKLALTGEHNLYNSLAASLSANLAGIDKKTIREALSDFKGVSHRLETVNTFDNITYINDSKATNVNSCWYALQSMTHPTILILGGKDKGNNYEEIREAIHIHCIGLVFLGKDNSKLINFFKDFGLPIADTNNMKDAVTKCREFAFSYKEKLDRASKSNKITILLSPCCASFDLYNSYEQRGELFREEIARIQKNAIING